MSELDQHQIYKRTFSGFVPDNDVAYKFWKDTELGQCVVLKGSKPRSLPHLRKYFALMTLVAQNHDTLDTPEKVHTAVKAMLGRGRWVQLPKASKPLFIEDSISFSAMNQETFDRFYNDAVNAIAKHLIGVDQKTLLDEVANF